VDDFKTWFVHKGIYQLPDGMRVIAVWTELGDRPRWWFAAEEGRIPGLWGDLQFVVYENRRLYNYQLKMDGGYPSLCIPYPSDLCIEDICAVEDIVTHNDE
jgi:hypothetical protein